MFSVRDTIDDVDDLVERVRAADTAVRSTLTSARAPTAAQYGQLRAALAGALGDVAAVRETLDTADVTEAHPHPDAAARLALWQWERGLRSALTGVRRRVLDTDAVVALAQVRRVARRHVVVSGDTLQAIAARYLGDHTRWTEIAATNGLSPGQPTPGVVLDIPDR